MDEVLPGELVAESMTLRCWRVDEAPMLAELVAANVDHLRPWMPWIATAPLPLADRRELIAGWHAERSRGGDAVYGVFVDGQPVGGCGLHRRIGPHGLELGYWIAASDSRRGLATNAARILTDAAFAMSGVDRVEIHHDKANVASAGVPRRLEFVFVGENADQAEAPGEVGVEWVWRMERSSWPLDAQ